MPKFTIYWNTGYGDTEEIIEAENHEAAEKRAYEEWREEAESQADFGAEEYDENAETDEEL